MNYNKDISRMLNSLEKLEKIVLWEKSGNRKHAWRAREFGLPYCGSFLWILILVLWYTRIVCNYILIPLFHMLKDKGCLCFLQWRLFGSRLREQYDQRGSRIGRLKEGKRGLSQLEKEQGNLSGEIGCNVRHQLLWWLRHRSNLLPEVSVL